MVVLALAACRAALDPNRPPTIRYGTDVCSQCGMIISEVPYAAAYSLPGGEARLFDDIGEMVVDYRQRREPVAAFFVHDHGTREWVRAEHALYVLSRALRTPMGFGVAAFATEADAAAMARQVGGEVLTFPELLQDAELAPDRGHRGA
jgi:copper chaperone NosL